VNTGKPPHPSTQTSKPRTLPHPLKLSETRVYISNKKYAPPCLVFQQQEPGGPCPWCLWFELSGRSVLGFHLKGPLLGGGGRQLETVLPGRRISGRVQPCLMDSWGSNYRDKSHYLGQPWGKGLVIGGLNRAPPPSTQEQPS